MMHTGGHVFIATNRNATAESIAAILNEEEAKKKAFTGDTFGGKTTTGGKITRRHGSKLGARMYGSASEQEEWVAAAAAQNQPSRQQAINIARRMKDGDVEQLSLRELRENPELAREKMAASPGKVYVLIDGEDNRHAEEKLMDALEQSGHKEQAVVAGKMRPCVTCSGRMAHTQAKGHDVVSNPRPGNIWLGQMAKQPDGVQSSTGQVIETKTSHASKTVGKSYGSESDTE